MFRRSRSNKHMRLGRFLNLIARIVQNDYRVRRIRGRGHGRDRAREQTRMRTVPDLRDILRPF